MQKGAAKLILRHAGPLPIVAAQAADAEPDTKFAARSRASNARTGRTLERIDQVSHGPQPGRGSAACRRSLSSRWRSAAMELEIETAASKQDAPAGEDGVKTETDVAAIRDAIVEKLTYALGKRVVTARPRDWFIATALTVRDRIVERWIASNDETHRTHRKRVYYLSLEFLIGRLLIDALTNMEMIEQTRAALAEAWRGSRGIAGTRTGCGARQWRPWPARRLFHGEHGDPLDRRIWLWHPLRSWLVPAANQGRASARISGRLVVVWQSLGISAAGIRI